MFIFLFKTIVELFSTFFSFFLIVVLVSTFSIVETSSKRESFVGTFEFSITWSSIEMFSTLNEKSEFVNNSFFDSESISKFNLVFQVFIKKVNEYFFYGEYKQLLLKW